jgi:hypothetical protein
LKRIAVSFAASHEKHPPIIVTQRVRRSLSKVKEKCKHQVAMRCSAQPPDPEARRGQKSEQPGPTRDSVGPACLASELYSLAQADGKRLMEKKLTPWA